MSCCKNSVAEAIDRLTNVVDGKRPRVYLKFGPVSEQTGPVRIMTGITGQKRGEVIAMNVLKANQKARIEIVATDSKGNSTSVQNPVLTVTDPAQLAITEDPDGSKWLSAVGPVGVSNLNLVCDVDLSEGGVKEFTGTAEVTVIAGDAATVVVGLGPAVEQ